MKIWDKYSNDLKIGGITSGIELAHFFAQADHESGLKPISENLNYSAQGLANTWPNRYADNAKARVKTPNAIAQKLARKPEQIANNVYANRMGNGGELSGDGWRFRGRGMFQITGREMYEQLSAYTGIDYINNPDWLLRERDSVLAAIWYWNKRGLSKHALNDDIESVTRGVNGGLIGITDRRKKLEKYKAIFL